MNYKEVIPVVPVSDVEAAAKWYQATLDFKIIHLNRDPEGEEATNYGVLRKETTEVHLVLGEASRKKPGTDVFCLVVQGIDELYQVVQGRKARITSELVRQAWGNREFKLSDLDGNEIVVIEKTGEY